MDLIRFSIPSKQQWISCFFIALISTPVASSPINNSVQGEPIITCLSDALDIGFATENQLEGRVFVKGFSTLGECTWEFQPSSTFNYSVRVRFNSCNVRRQRKVSPRGVEVSTTIVVQFHPVFLTKVDKAYHVQCFYMEASKTVTSGFEVSMLTTSSIDDTYPMPICEYKILSGSLDGPEVRFLRVGDKIVHSWQCRSSKGKPPSQSPFGMLIHSCFVSDGSGNDVLIVDKDGCSMDPYILDHLLYMDHLLGAFKEAHVFKFADRNSLLFTCQIRLCFKFMNTCRGMTPPRCIPLRNRRSIRGTRAGSLNATEEKDENVIDVQATRLIVLDSDDLANSTDSKRPELFREWENAARTADILVKQHDVCLSKATAGILCAFMVMLGVFGLGLVVTIFVRHSRPDIMKLSHLSRRT